MTKLAQILWALVLGATATSSSANNSNAAATTPQISFGDVNIVVVTDVHSWIGSHVAHEPRLNADYGDILSFYQHLSYRTPNTSDTFFVMNGDFMDGTGLSSYPPTHLTPILMKMPWDAVNMGNHELYRNEVVEHLIQPNGFVDHWNGTYLTSNILLNSTNKALGRRATYLIGRNTGVRILTFGFLYHMLNNCDMTIVEPVHETVKSKWFRGVLTLHHFDAILVLAHMDHQDPLVFVIHEAIRKIVGPDVPIQFITGHSHVRGFTQIDNRSTSFEAGRFLDTVGIASFPIVERHDDSQENMTSLFRHTFLDANVETLKNAVGVSNLTTPRGAALSKLIRDTQEELGLTTVLGCSQQIYDVDADLHNKSSLWSLYEKKVVPWLFEDDESSVLLQSSFSFRYSLMKGEIRWDDVIAIAPFNDTFYKVADRILGSDILKALGNSTWTPIKDASAWMLPNEIVSQKIDPTKSYNVYTVDFEVKQWAEAFQNVTGVYMDPIPLPNTTTSLWRDFVIHNMQECGSSSSSSSSSSTRRRYDVAQIFVHLAIPLALILGFVALRIYRRRKQRQGYEESLAQVEDLQLEPTYNTIIV